MNKASRSWASAMSMAKYWPELVAYLFVTLGGIAALTSAAFIWIYQLGMYLKLGEWQAITTDDVLYYMTNDSWFVHPNSWYGMYKLLAVVNGGWGILLAYLGITMVMITGHNKREP